MAVKIETPDPRTVRAEMQRLDQALATFAAAMRAKLDRKASSGWTGWDDQANVADLQRSLLAHAMQASLPMLTDPIGPADASEPEPIRGQYRQWLDVANIAMFLWTAGVRADCDRVVEALRPVMHENDARRWLEEKRDLFRGESARELIMRGDLHTVLDAVAR